MHNFFKTEIILLLIFFCELKFYKLYSQLIVLNQIMEFD